MLPKIRVVLRVETIKFPVFLKDRCVLDFKLIRMEKGVSARASTSLLSVHHIKVQGPENGKAQAYSGDEKWRSLKENDESPSV